MAINWRQMKNRKYGANWTWPLASSSPPRKVVPLRWWWHQTYTLLMFCTNTPGKITWSSESLSPVEKPRASHLPVSLFLPSLSLSLLLKYVQWWCGRLRLALMRPCLYDGALLIRKSLVNCAVFNTRRTPVERVTKTTTIIYGTAGC